MPTRVHTHDAPVAIGPYSQAMVYDGVVYCSGQIGLPAGGSALAGDTAAEQVRVALTNLGAVLEAAGSSFERVIKVTVYLVDMADYPSVNAVYGEFFDGVKPARAAVAVAGLPMNARVEVDCIAAV